MRGTVSVIMPAYKAHATIGYSVKSVLDQSYSAWELVIVADDGVDYGPVLGAEGITDTRIKFLDSGQLGGGASAARNVALDNISTEYAAILDADDRLKPQKLERAVNALAEHPIVTTALDVMDEQFVHLRFVASGPDRVLTPGAHKWVNISMDSMLVWDRRAADGRYDLSMSNMTDLEFLLQLYRTAPQSFHLGAPLHDYIKRAGSMSNSDKAKAGMIASKQVLLQRLGSTYYPLANDKGRDGLIDFLEVSLQAERLYAPETGQLFEDHLEPMLNKNGQPV
ncbi:glycosyltransferase family A protein [Devosia rhodophyticola]|uniref:Glycosyltransferase family A protein n=1 Tax=Devosia rhodophyticola TaxID=3026423 RepID=A0ABY7Z0G1_9HYPH|nr:glycosyltransferase family A protein [Devosia rhodophyticola]WDR07133.1 glycosyltransferase family A protein [Devosia rhodophyticola]